MKRTLKQRVLIAVAATTIAAASGMLVGYLVGGSVGIQMTERRLMQQASSILVIEESYSADARVMLAKANASPYPYCSDAEIAWFRNLIFQSEYLQEVGHMRDGRIDCSAILGREGIPHQQFKPDYSRWDGSRVYMNLAPLRNDKLPTTTVQVGNSFIVYNPYNTRMFDAPPIHYTIKLFDAPDRRNDQFYGSSTDVDESVPARDGQYRIHGMLYAVRCSSRFFNCVTTYIPIHEVLGADRSPIRLFTVIGCFVGACFGFLGSLLYRRSRSMEHQLRRAIARYELRVAYQPIVELSSRRIVGAEALARWTDEEGFAVGPEVFVQIAETRGFVGEITRLVVRKAVREMGETLRAHPEFHLSINVAAADLSDPEFLPMLNRSVEQAEVSPGSLVMEITESCTANHDSAIETIRQLRQRGYGVHIDDFGTGYSSLSYLHALSVDAIKIDISFTQAIGTEAVTVGILPQILAMAEALHLKVIVEGVETDQQANYFSDSAQPVLAQGWLFGRPVPAELFKNKLAEDELKAQAIAGVA